LGRSRIAWIAQVEEEVPPALWAEAQAQGLLRPELRL